MIDDRVVLEQELMKKSQKETMARWNRADPSGVASTHYQLSTELSNTYITPEGVVAFDQGHEFDHRLWKHWGISEFLGTTISPDFKGSDYGYPAMFSTIQEVSERCGGFGLSLLASTTLCTHQLGVHGSPDQQERHVIKQCTGEWHGAVGMTEPDHGTDAKGLQMKATKVAGGWLLNGTKTYITNGGTADKLVAFARTGTIEPNHLTAFIVTQDKDCKTISSTKFMQKRGMRASETWEMHFNDHFVPDEDVMGEVGDGLYIMLENLPAERVMLAAQSLGLAKSSYIKALAYLMTRKSRGKYLIEEPVIRDKMANMRENIVMAEDHAYNIVMEAEKGRKLLTRKERYEFLQNRDGMLKNSCAEMASQTTQRCAIFCGGAGFVEDKMGLSRNWNDSMVNHFGGGGDEVVTLSGFGDNGYIIKPQP
jgi:isovaleryl-CoA dehydrogenase